MHKLFDMLSVATLLAALALSSASPVHKRDDCEADTANDLSCVVYKFSAPFNDFTFLGQVEFIANLTTYTFNEDTRIGEFTDPQVVRLGLDDDEVVRCQGDQCDVGDYFSFEVCQKEDGTARYGTTSAQVIYGHVIHQNSGSDDGKQCVSAVDAAFGDDDDDDDNGDVGFNGSKLALQDCVYDMESSVHLGQYWRILLIYSYPVVSLVTSSNLTYAPDVALSNDNVPVTLSSGNELTLGSPYAWFSFQVPTSD